MKDAIHLQMYTFAVDLGSRIDIQSLRVKREAGVNPVLFPQL